ncbi:MAG: hypothetical protein QXX95_05230 [Nitrososphaerales archaeon]
MATNGRVWSEYNDALVRREYILLDFSFMNEWYKELDKAKDGWRTIIILILYDYRLH